MMGRGRLTATDVDLHFSRVGLPSGDFTSSDISTGGQIRITKKGPIAILVEIPLLHTPTDVRRVESLRACIATSGRVSAIGTTNTNPPPDICDGEVWSLNSSRARNAESNPGGGKCGAAAFQPPTDPSEGYPTPATWILERHALRRALDCLAIGYCPSCPNLQAWSRTCLRSSSFERSAAGLPATRHVFRGQVHCEAELRRQCALPS